IISIRNWNGSSWDPPTDLTASGDAVGSINTAQIPKTESGGLGDPNTGLDPLTFGEAAISFKAIFSNPALGGTIGSAFVKSRSSDSFQAEIKDFIAPEKVNVNVCPKVTTTATPGPVTVGSTIHDVAHLSGGFGTLGGTISFKVYAPGDTTCQTPTAVTPDVSVNGAGDYQSADFTTTQAGAYPSPAFYSGAPHKPTARTPSNAAHHSP